MALFRDVLAALAVGVYITLLSMLGGARWYPGAP